MKKKKQEIKNKIIICLKCIICQSLQETILIKNKKEIIKESLLCVN